MATHKVIDHAKNARRFLLDEERTDWHNQAVAFLRTKRDGAVHQLDEWEVLRDAASGIKDHTLSHLDEYLLTFEEAARKNGVRVHWAATAEEHNQIVTSILQKRGITKLVKSKSMLTEECGLNAYLSSHQIEVIDTDLGERIIQLRNEPPSHIVAPAIHIRKEEIGALFHDKLNTEPGQNDPQYLTEAARQHLRLKFLEAGAALTGVNFAIAETGGVVVCTNEGNADVGVHLVPIQIHSMGIEKVIPKVEHLGVFIRMLARSATGQPITIYTSHHHRPKPGGEMHVIIVDNGRSTHLGRLDFRAGLKCIRCGACINTCPVYRRSGGYSYGHTSPGPIGSILSPGRDLKTFSTLPFASTLCGACSDVCPVKIDIHQQLYKWRQIIGQKGMISLQKKAVFSLVGLILSKKWAYLGMAKLIRVLLRRLPKKIVNHPWNPWTRQRELPPIPKECFRDWYQRNRQ